MRSRWPSFSRAVTATAVAVLGVMLLVWRSREQQVDEESPSPALASAPPGASEGVELRSPFGPQRVAGLDVTFLVAADLHFGWRNVEASTADSDHRPARIEAVHERQLAAMRGLAGVPYPLQLGGSVDPPCGLLVAGDLTENGTRPDWQKFLDYYAASGPNSRLAIPVFEAIGNHDQRSDGFVARQVRVRHGSEPYSWDWGDLHLVSLGIAPNDRALEWLARDLAGVGGQRPIVLYQHYPLAGLYSDTWFVRDGFRRRLGGLLSGYNVVAIFHGHLHATGIYQWEGKDVFFLGSPKDVWRSFAVVHVTDRELTVAAWNYDLHAWWWWYRKGIDGVESFSVLSENRSSEFEVAPFVPEPIE